MTRTQANLIAYIYQHGHHATAQGQYHLTVISLDHLGIHHIETIQALWTNTREWLGY